MCEQMGSASSVGWLAVVLARPGSSWLVVSAGTQVVGGIRPSGPPPSVQRPA